LSTGLAGMRGTRTASDLGVGCSGVSRAPPGPAAKAGSVFSWPSTTPAFRVHARAWEAVACF